MEEGPRNQEQARDLRSIIADGIFFSLMVGVAEAYVPAFVLAAGQGEVVAGLIATVPMLIGALFQLVTPRAVRRLRSYRRWVVLCASLQALSLAPLIVGAVLGYISLAWLGASMVAYWAFGMATGPAWNAWVTSLVPVPIRARFFARRTRSAQAALFVAITVGGLLLQWGRMRDAELGFFALLFAAGLGSRLVSAVFLARQSESPGLSATHRTLRPLGVLHSIQAARSMRVLAYLLCMQICVNVAAPFFTPYMLGHLDFSYTEFMALTAMSFLARVAIMPLLGRIAHDRGTHVLLWLGALSIVPLPSLWLVSDDFWYLMVLQACSGCAWGALEFATMLSFFERIEDGDRASVLSAFNVGTAAAIALGAAVGSQIFSTLGASTSTYATLFVVSSVGRLAILLILRGTVPVKDSGEMSLRTLAVRPSGGTVQRPILATVASESAKSRTTIPGTPESPVVPSHDA